MRRGVLNESNVIELVSMHERARTVCVPARRACTAAHAAAARARRAAHYIIYF
eukprot:SAG31_NODE_17_length_35773_cov_25.999271_20_plen_53_part_00